MGPLEVVYLMLGVYFSVGRGASESRADILYEMKSESTDMADGTESGYGKETCDAGTC